MRKICTLCPRACAVDRTRRERGICGQTGQIKAARAALHFWEEPCISGEKGSGAVFFSGCPLHCVYCQNQSIANGTAGELISEERLAEIFLERTEQGAKKNNLVVAGPFAPQIIRAVEAARRQGMYLPIVFNTSGYENVDTVKMLEGIVDIYLPDFKYMDSGLSGRYSHAPDYSRVAKAALAEMVCQTGEAVFAGEPGDSLMKRGTIVRHLVLPGCIEDAKSVIRYLYETYGNTVYISIMSQFTPLPHTAAYPELNRRLLPEEYEAVVDYAVALGVENGFIQEGETAEESFIPAFDGEGVLRPGK